MKSYPTLLGLLLAGFLALPALADTDFQVRTMARQDVPRGMGQCDLRVLVDHESEVTLQGTSVHMRTIQGKEGRDAGSACNMPLPNGPVNGFNFQVLQGRGHVELVSRPSPRSSGAVMRILDSEGGADTYHIRMTWDNQNFNSQNRYGDNGYGNYGYDRGRDYGRDRGRWNEQGLRFGPEQAVNMCSDAVRSDISRNYRYDFNNVAVTDTRIEGNRGWTDTVTGQATARGRFWGARQFGFTCHLDLNSGTVSNLDVHPF